MQSFKAGLSKGSIAAFMVGAPAGKFIYISYIYERRRASTSHISFHLMDLTLISTQVAAGFDPKLYDLIFPSL